MSIQQFIGFMLGSFGALLPKEILEQIEKEGKNSASQARREPDFRVSSESRVFVLMLNHKIDFNNRQAVHEQIIVSNTLRLGALAWKGYQLKGTGAVVVYGLKERKTSFEESIDAEISYLSKEELTQSYREAIALFELLNEYDPINEMVVSFIHTEDGWIDSYRITLEIPLLNCFILQQEQLLSL